MPWPRLSPTSARDGTGAEGSRAGWAGRSGARSEGSRRSAAGADRHGRHSMEGTMRRSTCAFLGILVTSSLGAASWPGWRGPDGLGISEEPGVPDAWTAEKNVAWKAAIPGRGCSSPVIWEDRVFLTTAVEGERIPGAEAVKHLLGGEDFVHPESVGADRSHAFRVLCLDARSGKLLWERT